MFTDAIEQAELLGDPLLVAFAYQHAGRNHVDQHRFTAAVDAFRTALELRERHRAPEDQLESSRSALRATQRRINARELSE